LVDGEISRETSRFLVKRLGVDEELRATWSRYHLVRDCLRHQDGPVSGDDLCKRVSNAIDNEPELRPKHVSRARWLKPAAGLAIAASVALMAIVAVGPGPGNVPQTSGELANEPQTEGFTSPQSLTAAPYSRQVSLSGRSDAGDRKMNAYLLRHYQATGATSGKGFVTFVPIVITGSAVRPEPDPVENDPDSENSRDGQATPR